VVGLVAATSLYLAREFSLTSRRLVEQVKRTQEEEIARRLVETDNARKTRELEEARELQLSLLPSCRNDLPGLDACFQMETASEVGGDYYDYHSSADGSVTVVVGDATGHGMRAGTMVSIIKGLFVTHVPIGDVPAFLRKCSEAIKEMRLGNLFMGLTVAKIRNGALTVSSAGMPPVLLFRSASRSVEDIVIKSMPLGGPGPQKYEVREATLCAGDVVLLMSDGLPELFNPEGEILDYSAVRRFLAESAKGSAAEIANSLQEQGRRWAAGKSPGDDITLVVLKKT
jgi:serine phosphatase RsbU (regulator of sigma subunit)